MIDLDANATTKPCGPAIDAMAKAARETWHNPSSIHRAGQRARAVVELARRSLATLIGAKPNELVFTSGATESIELALKGALGSRQLVVSAAEHAAVRDLAEQLEHAGTTVARVPVTGEGFIDIDQLRKATARAPSLVSVHWANGETGAIQPIEAIAGACREHDAVLHVDAAQWVGRLPTDLASLDCDLMSFSPHKFHGTKGVGVLFARRNLTLAPVRPGSQELGRRGGTEAVPAIAAAGAAGEAAMELLADGARLDQLTARRERFEQRLLESIPDAGINGPADPGARVWSTSNVWFAGVEAEPVLLALSERGLLASAGSACSSGSLEPSEVLVAMGLPPERLAGSIRFSTSRLTTEAELDEAVGVIAEVVASARVANAPANPARSPGGDEQPPSVARPASTP